MSLEYCTRGARGLTRVYTLMKQSVYRAMIPRQIVLYRLLKREPCTEQPPYRAYVTRQLALGISIGAVGGWPSRAVRYCQQSSLLSTLCDRSLFFGRLRTGYTPLSRITCAAAVWWRVARDRLSMEI